MRAGKVVAIAALVGGLMAAPAQAAPHFVVGHGQNPGVAVDAAGTAYVGWQANTYADTGDECSSACCPRARARAPAWPRSRSRARVTASGA